MATTSEVESACSLPAWQGDDNRLEKTFNFDDFSAAVTASLWRSPLGTVTP
jgi:pterin-4a-carbinolamine dehydratase